MMRRIYAVGLIVLVAVLAPGCMAGRIVYYNFSGIEDFTFMPCREIKPSTTPYSFKAPQTPESVFSQSRQNALNAFNERHNTVAMLIIKDDVIRFEQYYAGYDRTRPSMAFSTSKSVLSILAGCAIQDGYIGSVDDPVSKYIPELAANGFDNVKLEHLLQMTGGLAYKESGNPFGRHTRYYYGEHLEDHLVHLKLKRKPGTKFEYTSGENQMLGLVLKRAIAPMTITEYLQRRIWDPLGMEYGGKWVVDNPNGMEKTFCGVVACARDFAKLGRLYLYEGDWYGTQIVPREWVQQSTKIDESEGSSWKYQYQWWKVAKDSTDFTTIGHLGQFIYVSPDNNVIIVRLGHNLGHMPMEKWLTFLSDLAKETGQLP